MDASTLTKQTEEACRNAIVRILEQSHIAFPEEPDAVQDLLTAIERNISILEYNILPQLPVDRNNELKYHIFKLREEYGDIRAFYRSKKVDNKAQYLHQLYLKSFDRAELPEYNRKNEGESGCTTEENDQKVDENEELLNLTAQDKLLQQNNVLTNKLQNVNNLMKSTLLAGEINLSELESSTNTLSQLSDSYAFFGDVLNKTNSLVKSINKASKSERAMIYRSLYFFTGVCMWILWRRIFKRPVLLLLWLIISPIRMLLFSSNGSDASIVVESSSATLLASTQFTSPVITTTTSSISKHATSISSVIKDEL